MCNLVVLHVHEIPCTTWHEMKRKGTVSQTLSIFTVFSSIPSMSHSLSKYLYQVISVLLVSNLLLLNQHYPLHPFPLLFSCGDCNHEEADTRMLVHVEHSLVNGANQIGINSEDTDVLIILLGFFHQLQSKYNFSDVVIDFSRTKRYSVSTLAEKLGTSICQALPFFHALTGSDTTSAFKM